MGIALFRQTKRANSCELALSKRLVGWRHLICIINFMIFICFYQFNVLSWY